ncbi:hypothetical protein GN244_ATG20662 [Phytophthora infestans]|uniref:Uncharacterized protein n=1 Tax=Phytophthora infestans TaxID=4787 RepID=A0A833W323_PHYIN|nr:hypothetical protein GN244_ATG20662 [Phytophthora infestans]KAF4127840.1 hypothetical protein GN958_ATG22976 [Phytophthora infestans]KAF4147834.1 hypothetical protein GN958_ATG02967 [Phytophthora infestans]
MDFVSVGLASPPPRRPTEAKGSATTTSSLPPLQTTSDISPSPRKHDKSRPIRVSSWSLTFAPGSPRRIPTDFIDHDASSPISPKVQKLHTRTRLLDDSRTRPALLQELLDYLHTELDGERESRKPSLRRLQIVREALNRLIDGFSVYAVQKDSAYSAEAKARSLVLKKRLAETQALLAASTAENARLTAALRSEKDNATKPESKLTDV